jgi:hypothetical protein
MRPGPLKPPCSWTSNSKYLQGHTATASKYSSTGYLIPVCTNDGVYDGVVNVPVYGTLLAKYGPHADDILQRPAREPHLVNKFNVQAVNTFFTQSGQPPAAFDPLRMIRGSFKLD